MFDVFQPIRGQGRALGLLEQAVREDALPNGYLFVGPRGVGKFTTAMALAQAVMCTAPDQARKGCGVCAGCRKVVHARHPDVLVLKPSGKGQQIKVDDVREVAGPFLALRPNEGPRKLVLIDGADRLNAAAANALLKSLEEPGPFTRFVLVAPGVRALLPTIVSRCRVVRFQPLPLDELLGVIGANAPKKDAGQFAGIDAATGAFLEALSGGSPGVALAFLKDHDLAAARAEADALLDALDGAATGPTGLLPLLTAFEAHADSREDYDALLSRLQALLAGELRRHVQAHPDTPVTGRLAQLDALRRARGQLRLNPAAKIQAEALALRLSA
jgi:DNA polymerase III subunit delta'